MWRREKTYRYCKKAVFQFISIKILAFHSNFILHAFFIQMSLFALSMMRHSRFFALILCLFPKSKQESKEVVTTLLCT